MACTISGDNYKGAGGIVGGANALTEVYNCTNVASIFGAQQGGAGGIVGRAAKCTVSIDSCINRGPVTSRYGGSATNPSGIGAGGLIAGNWGNDSVIKISNSANYGAISTTTNNCDAGGLVACFNSQGETLYITNSFNYGSVSSEKCAGGIVGKLYKHFISICNIGNSGAVTSTGSRAGGFCGLVSNGGHHTYYDICGFLNYGNVVGAESAGLVFGGYEDLGNYIDTKIRVYSGILAGSVSATADGGSTGSLSGAKVGDCTCVLVGAADENCRVLQSGLNDYYNSEGAQQLSAPIAAMVAADLTNGSVKDLLNVNATATGTAAWIKGAAYPELSLFAVEAKRRGLIVFVR